MQSTNSHNIKTVPDRYTTLTHWVISSSSEKLLAFIKGAFGAEEVPNSRVVNDKGIIINLVAAIGDSLVLMFDSREGWGITPAFLNLYVDNLEEACRKALSLGATSVTDPTTLWFGDRVCRILDPLGNIWWLSERVEEVDRTNAAEVKRRASAPEALQGIAYIQKSLDEGTKAVFQFQHLTLSVYHGLSIVMKRLALILSFSFGCCFELLFPFLQGPCPGKRVIAQPLTVLSSFHLCGTRINAYHILSHSH